MQRSAAVVLSGFPGSDGAGPGCRLADVPLAKLNGFTEKNPRHVPWQGGVVRRQKSCVLFLAFILF